MTDIHRRHRKFNTRDTYPEQNIDNDLCQVVVARGTMVFVRGQVGQEIEGFASVADAGAAAQAEQAMRNVAQLLGEVGADVKHICRIQVYLTDRRHRDAVYQVIGRWLKGVYPVSTGLVVSGLARPEWVMEVEATAVIPDGDDGDDGDDGGGTGDNGDDAGGNGAGDGDNGDGAGDNGDGVGGNGDSAGGDGAGHDDNGDTGADR